MSDILVLGSINMDLVVKAHRSPEAGETLFGEQFMTIPGGKGANQAVASARLSASVGMIGRVGADAFGLELKAKLKDNGVDTIYIDEVEGVSTGTALIVVEGNGENRILVVPGANSKITNKDIDSAHQALKDARILVTQLETPLESIIYAVEQAKSMGKTVIFNPAPAPIKSLPIDFLSLVDILVINETEAKSITGAEIETIEDAIHSSRQLQTVSKNMILLTLGEKGTVAINKDEAWFVPAFNIDTVDTTAAGDAFIGAIAVFAGKMGLSELLVWANGAGAITASRLGAQTSLPDLPELKEFIKKYGNQIKPQKL